MTTPLHHCWGRVQGCSRGNRACGNGSVRDEKDHQWGRPVFSALLPTTGCFLGVSGSATEAAAQWGNEGRFLSSSAQFVSCNWSQCPSCV